MKASIVGEVCPTTQSIFKMRDLKMKNTETLEIKIKSEGGRVPKYQTEDAAGFDLPAYLPEGDMLLEPGERALIPTGIYMELPKGYEAQVRARSGLSIKHGLTMVNGVGTIDADYRGELKVPMINLGQEPFTITDGLRIAQVVIARYERAKLVLADSLDDTARGDGGFGHTGV